MVPQGSPCCLLIISSVCLNHAVLLGLKNIFQLVSTPAGETRSWGGWNAAPWFAGRFKLHSASFQMTTLWSSSLYHLIIFTPLFFLIVALLSFLPKVGVTAAAWIGKRQGKEKRTCLAGSSFLPLPPFFHQALPSSATLDVIQFIVLMYSL